MHMWDGPCLNTLFLSAAVGNTSNEGYLYTFIPGVPDLNVDILDISYTRYLDTLLRFIITRCHTLSHSHLHSHCTEHLLQNTHHLLLNTQHPNTHRLKSPMTPEQGSSSSQRPRFIWWRLRGAGYKWRTGSIDACLQHRPPWGKQWNNHTTKGFISVSAMSTTPTPSNDTHQFTTPIPIQPRPFINQGASQLE